MKQNAEKIEALYQLILKLETREDCQALFEDLCTVKEMENMAERLYTAKLLIEGNTITNIDRTGISAEKYTVASEAAKAAEAEDKKRGKHGRK